MSSFEQTQKNLIITMSSPDSSQRAATGNTESSHSEAVGVLASPVEANSKVIFLFEYPTQC